MATGEGEREREKASVGVASMISVTRQTSGCLFHDCVETDRQCLSVLT